MPKVRPLTQEQQIEYEWNRRSEQIFLDCKRLRIKNKELAAIVGVDPSTISKQFRAKKVQYPTVLAYERLKGEKENMK